VQATETNDQKVSFTVPSGNFGNICAGHVARMMGLPIDKLVVATNENDVLDEFFRTGVYRVRGSADTHETSSPSMDISKASNFERFVFDLLGRDAAQTKALFGDALSTQGRFDLSQDPCLPTRPPSTASRAARARTPTAWPPSATPTALWRHHRHPHRRWREGGARAPGRRQRAHDRAGDGPAHQVR
jgi:threonine synthase